MNRCLLSFVAYLLTFMFGVVVSRVALPVFGLLAAYPLVRGLFAGVMTLSTAIFLLSSVIRVICGNRLTHGFSTRAALDEGERRELRELN